MKQFELRAEKSVNSTEYDIKDGRIELVINDDNILYIRTFECVESDEHGFKLPKGMEGSRIYESSLVQLKFTREQALQLKEWIDKNIH